MLLGCAFGEGLEPVGVMGDTQLCGPLLHAFSHSISHLAVELRAIVHHVYHLLVHILLEVFVHLLTIEYFATKILCRTVAWCLHFERLLLESLSNYLKS